MTRPEMIDMRGLLPRNKQNEARWLRKRPTSAIRDIVVHWNGPRVDQAEGPQLVADANYHIQKNWALPGQAPAYGWALMYHYAVGTTGRVYWCNDEEDVLWHDTDGNYCGLAVHCILGDGQRSTPAMLDSLRKLLDWLCDERPDLPAGRGDVWGHGERVDYRNYTSCPGPEIRGWVAEYRAGARKGHWFHETNLWVADDFFRFWTENGGVRIFGFPWRTEMPMKFNGTDYQVQYFERARFERAPDGTISLGRVGAELAAWEERNG